MTEGGQPGGCFPWPGVWAFPEELGATSWGDPGDTEDLLLTPRQRANALGQQWGRGALSSPGASVDRDAPWAAPGWWWVSRLRSRIHLVLNKKRVVWASCL